MKRPRRAGSSQDRLKALQETHRALEADYGALAQRLEQAGHDLKQCQAEKTRLEETVNRVNTLAALGQMAATVAHEIRNPLGGIAGFAGLLERDLSVDDPRRRWVKKIIEGVSSLNAIVTGLLHYTRPVRLNAHPIDMVNLVEESASFLEIDLARRDEGRIAVARIYEASGAVCEIDPEQVQQVLLNLLQNAAQAMPDGGTITVSVKKSGTVNPHHPPFPHSPTPPFGAVEGNWVEVAVADTGHGMSEEVQKNLFTPFFTTKENGTGLGLATARKIVEAHRGAIRVTSEIGRGSIFVVAIPATS